ncbi:hypothetical protein RRG08_039628 [Elysia crispata]|uniref:Uncharacterized protein n=1 Tax=Elysia crispata TaxID=231223 RepID=A0AAE1CVP0_9GAST|nr:hypothetical protein RRG08_039628 [Elysia crispata]
MRLQKLKETIDAGEDVDIDEEKNAEAYAELIQFLDDKSLSLVMRDAADDGRKALQILREHYAGSSTPRIVSLYTELTSLIKRREESVTEYVIRAETAAAALRNAGETVSDSLVIAMIVKGLPDCFQSFVAVITQSEKKQSISEFKVALRSFEETEQSRQHSKDSILKSSHGPPTSTTTRWKHGAFSSSHTGNNPRPATGYRHDPGPTCYNCEKHTIELANGDRISVSEARGDANVKFKNSNGDFVDVILKDALFVPSFPQNIFFCPSCHSKWM